MTKFLGISSGGVSADPLSGHFGDEVVIVRIVHQDYTLGSELLAYAAKDRLPLFLEGERNR